MPTYYNGKEITSTSIMSGLSLVGKSSINFGGRTITLSADPPPPTLDPVRLFDGGRIPDPNQACSIGMGGNPLDLYSSEPPGDGVFIFQDSAGNTPFDGGDAFYYDSINNVVYLIDISGRIVTSIRCR